MFAAFPNLPRGVFVAILLAVAGVTVSCSNRPSTEPKPEDLTGRYVPSDLTDKRMHAGSELVLRSDGGCDLKDFPVVSYSSGTSDVFYYTNSGTWRLKKDLSTWTMVIDLHSQIEVQLNVLNSGPPYRIAQEGESVEDDMLFFDKTKQ
jgi:hypothetical protein